MPPSERINKKSDLVPKKSRAFSEKKETQHKAKEVKNLDIENNGNPVNFDRFLEEV